jgi:hypothetical protein
MIATLLVALFAAVAVTSVITLADAAVRGRNAFRLLRMDSAQVDGERRVTVRFEGEDMWQPLPALRPLSVRGARGSRRVVWTAKPLRAAA